jgi:hypothetical protein
LQQINCLTDVLRNGKTCIFFNFLLIHNKWLFGINLFDRLFMDSIKQ